MNNLLVLSHSLVFAAEHRSVKTLISVRLGMVGLDPAHAIGVATYGVVYHLSAFGVTSDIFFRPNHDRPMPDRAYEAVRRRLMTAYHGSGLGSSALAGSMLPQPLYDMLMV